jgi:hypothetical protein
MCRRCRRIYIRAAPGPQPSPSRLSQKTSRATPSPSPFRPGPSPKKPACAKARLRAPDPNPILCFASSRQPLVATATKQSNHKPRLGSRPNRSRSPWRSKPRRSLHPLVLPKPRINTKDSRGQPPPAGRVDRGLYRTRPRDPAQRSARCVPLLSSVLEPSSTPSDLARQAA